MPSKLAGYSKPLKESGILGLLENCVDVKA
jgi:hypothetical protein